MGRDVHSLDISDEKESEEMAYTVEDIKRAMLVLPHGYREVFSLYLIEGYDHVEISEILKISESTSKSQYSRARAKIKEIIKSQQNAGRSI
jgi:RNA polymerase sigma-70 factor (ECF subfamily)